MQEATPSGLHCSNYKEEKPLLTNMFMLSGSMLCMSAQKTLVTFPMFMLLESMLCMSGQKTLLTFPTFMD
jgi:hypothetical protein